MDKGWEDEASNAYYKASKVIGKVNNTNIGIKQCLDDIKDILTFDTDIKFIKETVKQRVNRIEKLLENVYYDTLKKILKTGKEF